MEISRTGMNNVNQYSKAEAAVTPTSESQYPNSIMDNGLPMNVDPKGEIARKAYLEELARQINESICKVKSYYAAEHEETMSFENPYVHLQEKYNAKYNKMFPSAYFKANMPEKERKLAYEQELAMFERREFYDLSDPYAWAAYGGVPNREQQLQEAVQKALTSRKEELVHEVGGESSYEEYSQKIVEKFMLQYSEHKQSDCMGTLNLKA